jgi:predicted P-loop ATPase
MMGDLIQLRPRSLDTDAHVPLQMMALLPHPPSFGKDGTLRVKPTLANLITILERDPDHEGKYRLDLMSGEIKRGGVLITDAHGGDLAVDLARMYGIDAGGAKLHEAIVTVAAKQAYHPVRDYLGTLVWDGVPRIDSWLTDLCGAIDTPLHRLYARRWLVSAIARVMQPGAKVDTVLVLAGKQGAGKSSILHALGGAWYVEGVIDPHRTKDSAEVITGAWIFELGELDSVRRSEATSVKAFLSRRDDHYRPAYGRFKVVQPRQVVFAGTTNEEAFLTDSTGNRRYWPVRGCDRVDVARATAERDHLWAEALVAYQAGEPWWLTAEEETARQQDLDAYTAGDPWCDALEALHLPPEITMADACGLLDIDVSVRHSGTYRRVASALQALGYTQHKTTQSRTWRK